MVTLIDYLVKDSRPKKPVTLLWGPPSELASYYRKSTDLVIEHFDASLILAHAHTEPLFTEKATLWVKDTPEVSFLTRLVSSTIYQPVIFDCNTKETAPEYVSPIKTHTQVVLKGLPSSGSKAHKDFLSWYTGLEFSRVDPKIISALADVASPHFGDHFFETADNLRKFTYLIPSPAFKSVSSFKAALVQVTPDKWDKILEVKGDPIISEILDFFFSKSRNVYPPLTQHLLTNEAPLLLISALISTTRYYLDSVWAIKEAQGKKQDPQAFAQGRRVPMHTFLQYQSKVSKLYGERSLWCLLKDLCIIQARYRSGEKSPLPLYQVFLKNLGSGI